MRAIPWAVGNLQLNVTENNREYEEAIFHHQR